ncbi:MAG TPA: hypothetical protein VE779_08140 [Candidatus Angelobacter sp.]|nr:hypothetical protein [Candidatus Angelobacter sp.]
MSRVAVFPDSLTLELHRLHRVEERALPAGDVPTFVHARLRWCELILTLCPGLAPAAPTLARRLAHVLPTPATPLPRWKLEQRARPLVPIVSRVVKAHKLASGAVCHSAVEQLACGHTHELVIVIDGDLKARHRRCRECGAARLLAADASDKANTSVPAAQAAGNSVRKGGRGESPEPLSRAAVMLPWPMLVTPA